MDRLNYSTIEKTGYEGYILKDAPERVLQFGEGNFLRAFADHFIDLLNERAEFNGKVLVCQPRGNRKSEVINSQNGLYTLILRGKDGDRIVEDTRIVSCISRCINPNNDHKSFIESARNPFLRFIISNTTEAGIVYDPSCELSDTPASSFPGKLTQFLYERYKCDLPGFIILPCELTDRNGYELRRCVEKYIIQWGLPAGFSEWVMNCNTFCSTLVDRIVPGYPKDEAESICRRLGYTDDLLCVGEVFATWVIECDKSIMDELPVVRADLPILITDNVDLYRKRKVRMLNGVHTSLAMAAFLAGRDTVGECMEDEVIRKYIQKAMYEEIIPVIDEFDRTDLERFASAVFDRLANPFISHELLSISLNSTSKWKVRILPTVTEYFVKYGKLPEMLTFSFAAYISFYHNGSDLTDEGLQCRRGDRKYNISDDRSVLEFFFAHKDDEPDRLVETIIDNEDIWGNALKDLDGFAKQVTGYLELIESRGMYEAIRHITSQSERREE